MEVPAVAPTNLPPEGSIGSESAIKPRPAKVVDPNDFEAQSKIALLTLDKIAN